MDPQSTAQPSKDDVARWLSEHGDLLYRFALKRVGAADIAEDLVQETFLAALRSAADFQGRSKVETWLVSILRHKITDYLRKVSRQRERDEESKGETTQIFHKGIWRVGVKTWPDDPAKSMLQQEFWRALDDCQTRLPVKLALAFRMRDLEELSISEICESLEITATNLSVRLHRARVLLRECLDQNWFTGGKQS